LHREMKCKNCRMLSHRQLSAHRRLRVLCLSITLAVCALDGNGAWLSMTRTYRRRNLVARAAQDQDGEPPDPWTWESERKLQSGPARECGPTRSASEFVGLIGSKRAASRGSVKGRGKKGHFLMLDRFIRRIDDLMPEEMENMVMPLNSYPNLETTSHTLKISFPAGVNVSHVTEDDVRSFFRPLEPVGVITGWHAITGETQAYAHFETNEETQQARQKDGQTLASIAVDIKYSDDGKWEKLQEKPSLEQEEVSKIRKELAERPPLPQVPDGVGSRGRPWRPPETEKWRR